MKKSFQLSAISYQLLSISISALFLILSFPNFNLWLLAWFALVPLLLSIEKTTPLKAFLASYLTGFLFFLGTICWLAHVTLPGMMIVAAYLAVYFGIFGFFASFGSAFTYSPVSGIDIGEGSDALLGVMKSPDYFLKRHTLFNKYLLLVFLPSAWTTSEWLRSKVLTGFPWALLGHSQAFNLPAIQVADISGAYGVGFFIVFINALVCMIIREARISRKIPRIPAIIAFLSLVIVLRYGYIRMNNIFTGAPLKVCVVQGNIPQARKWDENFRGDILEKYEDLTKLAVSDRPDLIIWPETAVPGFMESESGLFLKVRSIALSVKTPLLVGTPREGIGREARCYNSASLFSEEGNITDTYDKIHLVPFGEYIPFKERLSFVEKFAHNPIGDFAGGKDFTVFRFFIRRAAKSGGADWNLMKRVSFSCLICFEDIFPELSRRFIAEGASFLVNITNDAWFMESAAPYQHAQCSVFRAVENRTCVVRAANTGLSCFIDQKGRITKTVNAGGRDIFVDGYAAQDIILNRARTFYNRYGDVFAHSCVVFVLAYLVISRIVLGRMNKKGSDPF